MSTSIMKRQKNSAQSGALHHDVCVNCQIRNKIKLDLNKYTVSLHFMFFSFPILQQYGICLGSLPILSWFSTKQFRLSSIPRPNGFPNFLIAVYHNHIGHMSNEMYHRIQLFIHFQLSITNFSQSHWSRDNIQFLPRLLHPSNDES